MENVVEKNNEFGILNVVYEFEDYKIGAIPISHGGSTASGVCNYQLEDGDCVCFPGAVITIEQDGTVNWNSTIMSRDSGDTWRQFFTFWDANGTFIDRCPGTTTVFYKELVKGEHTPFKAKGKIGNTGRWPDIARVLVHYKG